MRAFSVSDVTRNPVLRRELDERAASKRAAVAMSLWLLLLTGLALLVYYAYTADGSLDPVSNDSARIGKDLFEWTLFGMMGLVLFLVPAFTASSVAGERTRQTLIPVQMTTLGPLAIVLGKSLAAIAFTFPITMALMSVMSGLSIGCSSVIARRIGAGEGQHARRLSAHGLLLALLGLICLRKRGGAR